MVISFVSQLLMAKDLMIVTNSGVIIRLEEDISQNGRATQGVRLMKLGDDQFVSTVAKAIDKTEDEDATEAAQTENGESNAESTESPSEEVIDDDTQVTHFILKRTKKLQFHLRMTQQMNVLKLDKTSWIV